MKFKSETTRSLSKYYLYTDKQICNKLRISQSAYRSEGVGIWSIYSVNLSPKNVRKKA
jgi:hypothetical protein